MPGLNVARSVVAKSFRIHLTRCETFQHHIRYSNELLELNAVRFSIEIENLTGLAGVEMSERGAEQFAFGGSDEGRQVPDRIAAGWFYLDYLHTQIGKHAAA